jgi:uncharacterized phiE125 gp8 family phage protein
MPVSLQRTSVTGTEPVTLDEMKAHLRVDFTDDDDLITALIVAARERAEAITGRTITASSWLYSLDSFPYNWQLETAPARSTLSRFVDWWANAQAIQLPQGPLINVTSVNYIPSFTSSAYTTLDPSLYIVDNVSTPPMIYPTANYYWPSVWAIHNAVQISFTAGYSDPNPVPEGIKVAIRMMVGGWYENREDSGDVPKVAEYLLSSHKIQSCGYVGR